MPKVYLAGPIAGCSYDEATKWRDKVTFELHQHDIECYSPMRGKDHLRGETEIHGKGSKADFSTPEEIMSRDFFDVKRCDLMLVNFLGASKVSIGTVMEVAWAYLLQKPAIVIAEPDNVHVNHPMMKTAIIRVDSLEAGIKRVKSYLRTHIKDLKDAYYKEAP